MASLYDLELQESNNFIHALLDNGKTPALKLLADQKAQCAAMGEVGKQMQAQFDDPNSEIGKSFVRLQTLEKDIVDVMNQVKLTSDDAAAVNVIFSKSPDSLSVLNEEEQKRVKDYWLKKKSIIFVLLQKGYTQEELFA